jgi:hypothetical protein
MNAKFAPDTGEKRQETRASVNLDGQNNHFFVEFAGQTFPIANIRDVSVSGVGLQLDQMIAQGETIELAYTSDDLDLKVKGNVIWCDGHDRPVSVGVEFCHDTPQDNMLFFMAMRKFLDEFDGVTMDA